MVDPCLRNNSETCPQCPGGLANPPSCDICFDDRLDPHTNCTTCLPGNSNCQVSLHRLSVGSGGFHGLVDSGGLHRLVGSGGHHTKHTPTKNSSFYFS